jgi:hypothetical protein
MAGAIHATSVTALPSDRQESRAGRSPEQAPSNHPEFNEPNAWNQSSGARLRDFNHASILSRLKRQSLPILNAGSSPRPANLQTVERLTLRKFATSPVVSRSDVGSAVPARRSWDGRARWSREASLRPPVSSTRFALGLKVANLGSGLAFPKTPVGTGSRFASASIRGVTPPPILKASNSRYAYEGNF